MLHCNGIDPFVTLMGNFNWGPISRNDIVSKTGYANDSQQVIYTVLLVPVKVHEDRLSNMIYTKISADKIVNDVNEFLNIGVPGGGGGLLTELDFSEAFSTC